MHVKLYQQSRSGSYFNCPQGWKVERYFFACFWSKGKSLAYKILNIKGLIISGRIRFFVGSSAIFAFLGGTVIPNPSWAQTVPSSAEPQRLDKRFQEPQIPRSVMEPEAPEKKEYLPAEGLKKIRFVLKKINIKGSTVYSRSTFKRWENRKALCH